MSEPDFRKMGDPMNDRLPPNDNLLNRRRRKDLARIVGPRTLDGENVCTRCGVPDVHCQCDDRIDYDAQFDEGTARDDYAELRRIVKKIGLLHAERERLILKAHQEGASLREIAEILEVNHVTVRNALQKLSWRIANEKPPDDKEGSTGTG